MPLLRSLNFYEMQNYKDFAPTALKWPTVNFEFYIYHLSF